MNSNGNKQAYDRGVNIFSPDGRLYQVEYAREAVKRGAPSIGIRTQDGVVLAARTRTQSDLRVSESIEKIHKVDDAVGVASTGHVADGRRLVDHLRVLSQHEQLRYGERATIDALSRQMSDHIQESTQMGGRRPYGASLLLGGVDDTGPHLYEVEPGGTPTEWEAVAVGDNRGDFMNYLGDAYSADLLLDDALALALDAFAEFSTGDITPETVDIATITTEDEQLHALTADELATHIEA